MTQPLVQTDSVGKFYPARLTTGRLLRYLWPSPPTCRPGDFWALRDVSLCLPKGQILGIIGKNGSGKSTLLQIVAGLLEPSEGHVEVSGNTAALLELGAGFNPDFTGRENIFLSGAVYGISRDEIRQRFGAIVAFADIGDHLGHPVKTYSSGMFARLAFAVAIQSEPDILIVDEILSVGDIAFQAKCYQRIEKLKSRGTSILFVSHDLNSVQTLCDEVLLLDRGRVAAMDIPKNAIDEYLHLLSREGQDSWAAKEAPRESGGQSVRAEISGLELINSKGRRTIHPHAAERCRLRYTVRFNDDMSHPVVSLQLKTMLGLVISDQTSLFFSEPIDACRKGEEIEVEFELTMNLCPGPFRVGVGIADVQDGTPVPIFGNEDFTFEVISDRKAYGIAYLGADFCWRKLPGQGEVSQGGERQ